MAVIHAHYPATSSGSFCAVDDELLTGMFIDYAEVLGWDQGFDPEGRLHFAWQINQAASLVTPEVVSFSLQVTLSPDRTIPPPFAGIAACMDGLLRRLGHRAPGAFAVGVDPQEARLRELPEVRLGRFLPAVPHEPTTLAVAVSELDGKGSEAPLPALDDLLAGCAEMVTGPRPCEDAPRLPAPALPSWPGAPWRPLGAIKADLTGWGPVAVGRLANLVLWNAQCGGLTAPVLLSAARTTAQGAARGEGF